jgi:hypothetical protein
MTTMTRALQRGIVVFAALALLAAACGDTTTTNDEAAGETARSTTVEETTPSTTIEETAPSAPVEETTPSTAIEGPVPSDSVEENLPPAPSTQEPIADPPPATSGEEEMSAEDRFDYGCLPWDDPLPFPGTVTAVAGGSYGYDMWLMAVAIEEVPDPILMFFNEPHGLWAALDQASAEYTGFPELDGPGKELIGLGNPDLPAAAMQASIARCLASMET